MLYRIQDKLDYYVSFFVDYLGLLRLLQQILQTGWLSRNLLLTVLEARSQRSGCQHGWVLGRAFFLVCRHPFSPWTLTWWRKREKKGKNGPLIPRAHWLVCIIGMRMVVERLTKSYNIGEKQTISIKEVHRLRWRQITEWWEYVWLGQLGKASEKRWQSRTNWGRKRW